MPNPSGPESSRRQRSWTLIAAGLLIAALGLVVLYTQRVAFLSPVALVVIAAIGVAALLLQLRLRPDLLGSGTGSTRGPLWLNALGVGFAVAAVIGDMIHLSDTFLLMAALAAVACFAVSGIIVLSALRKRRT